VDLDPSLKEFQLAWRLPPIENLAIGDDNHDLVVLVRCVQVRQVVMPIEITGIRRFIFCRSPLLSKRPSAEFLVDRHSHRRHLPCRYSGGSGCRQPVPPSHRRNEGGGAVDRPLSCCSAMVDPTSLTPAPTPSLAPRTPAPRLPVPPRFLCSASYLTPATALERRTPSAA
jgi:hypothetical protein